MKRELEAPAETSTFAQVSAGTSTMQQLENLTLALGKTAEAKPSFR